ncbi:MAG: hypothetical protein MPI95_01645 [Nitrosopumilus sp.]|nr:hypothetical protein [Nitrosopumilus sp.]CAI9831532.1 conserved hypothetical protein [Nitrosopumilaceae archaeon]MDA7940815.1 hypothetical protein [Nitrosopumilus sp.]MDA7943023.1 hypothetical protein [Nitrosopumilus sp.]MDA7944566.1 hypothetical protein [Nitrosopumilus sp.]
MIGSEEMGRILRFVADRWVRVADGREPKPLVGLPGRFWMNSVGGRTAKGGFWVTSLMYTENEADAAAFREVLLRWQSRGAEEKKGPDLIQIGKSREDPGARDG